MATLLELEAQGALDRLDPGLMPGEQEFRRIYALPSFKTWLLEDLTRLGSTWQREISPNEQVFALFAQFCAGEPLTIGTHLSNLVHHGDGIWYLKTPDIRIFGWFYQKDYFIGSGGDCAEKIKHYNLYHGFANQAVLHRNRLNLNEPKFVPGDNPNDVVSAFNFAL